jgi:chromate transporter
MNTRLSPLEVFRVFLKLGVSCFGGPVAHIGYFHEEFVVRRQWLDDPAFADIVALCQFLPGPASSQLGLAIGMHRAGWLGALAAWIGFTTPSVLLMIAFAYGIGDLTDPAHAGWLAGLKLVALPVVAQAVWIMAFKFCRTPATTAIALIGTVIILARPSGFAPISVIALGAILGWRFFHDEKATTAPDEKSGPLQIPYGPRFGSVLLALFLILFLALPLLTAATHNPAVATFSNFYWTGSLVFGGGHVVLPLLQNAVVNPGWVDNSKFLAGYGAAQALPGPLFSFSAYLGTVMKPEPNGWLGGLWCLLAIYLPGSLLVFAALPFWENLRRQSFARAVLKGANAAVVGLLLAALYHPIWTSTIQSPADFLLALVALGLLVIGRWPPWLVVAFSALGGAIFLR